MLLFLGYSFSSFFFFFNDTATTEIYTLSLHDALPILFVVPVRQASIDDFDPDRLGVGDRKSTRLNFSHLGISYAVFCLKKKKKIQRDIFLKKKNHQKHNKNKHYTKK